MGDATLLLSAMSSSSTLCGCRALWRIPVELGGPQFVATKRSGIRNWKEVLVRGFTSVLCMSTVICIIIVKFYVEEFGA